MGCCTSLQNNLFTGKEIIVNLGPKEIEEFIGRNRNNSKKSSNTKYSKFSSKTLETNSESPKKTKKQKKGGNFHNQRTKDIAKNLRLITILEVKNTRKFFVLNDIIF